MVYGPQRLFDAAGRVQPDNYHELNPAQ